MTIAQSILAVANKVSEILGDINTAITNKGGSSVNCLDDVAGAVGNIPSPPANNIVITDSFGERTIYFDGFVSGNDKYDLSGVILNTVKAVDYGDVTQVYAAYGSTASDLESIRFSSFVGMGASAEIYFGTADGIKNCEVGSVAYPQNFNDITPILTILWSNLDVETITVYADTTDADYETLVAELNDIAAQMTDCTLTIYDVTDGTATLHGGE